MALRSIKKKVLASACPSVSLGDELGAGGNARVYAGTSVSHGMVAVKFLLNDNTKRYNRFRDEVLVVTTLLRGSKRVLPILDHHLPDSLKADEVPWYVMPAARRLTDSLKGKPWLTRLQAMAELAEGLAELHGLKVAHRDIKPENLFELDGEYRFGDFGIAAFPDRAGITSTSEPMGPWGYMAPEMLSSPTTADPYRADVYSFAKTVWAILTGERIPFGGHYAAQVPVGLSTFDASKDFVVEPLDTLLEQSTRVSPDERPTAKQLAAMLRDAIDLQDDFARANVLQWEAAEVDALRGPGLTRAVWEGAREIARVITTLSRRNGLNHCFFPAGGGLTIEGAAACEAEEMLSLRMQFSGLVIVKPIRLTLERFAARSDFSYAVLETADTAPLGAERRFRDDEMELLKQVNGYDYVRDDSDDDEPRSANVGVSCQRFFKGGVFVIAPTTGVFNQLDDYMGTSARLGRDKVRELFERLVKETVQPPGQIWRLTRKVRLLSDAPAVDLDWGLEYIDEPLFEQIVALDDALVAERKNDFKGPRTINRKPFDDLVEEILYERPTPSRQSAIALFRRMTSEQRGEYLAVVQVARGDVSATELKSRTAANIRSKHEDHYLLEKLGNGYMRKALARFGLHAPAPKDHAGKHDMDR